MRKLINGFRFASAMGSARREANEGRATKAVSIMENAPVPDNPMWSYSLTMGEILLQSNDRNAAITHFDGLIDLLGADRFNDTERFHAASYLQRKHGFLSEKSLTYIKSISNYNRNMVSRRMLRLMPLSVKNERGC